MISFGERFYSNQYDKISGDEISACLYRQYMRSRLHVIISELNSSSHFF